MGRLHGRCCALMSPMSDTCTRTLAPHTQHPHRHFARLSLPQRRHQWVAPGNAARLMYFQAEEGLIYALEVPAWKFGLVVGEVQILSCVGHH